MREKLLCLVVDVSLYTLHMMEHFYLKTITGLNLGENSGRARFHPRPCMYRPSLVLGSTVSFLFCLSMEIIDVETD